MRTGQAWNDGWEFAAGSGGRFTAVRLPHANLVLPANHFNENDYQFESVYRKRFSVPAERRGQGAWLVLEGAMLSARVVLNGLQVGAHRGGYTAFRCDLSDALRPEGENILEVFLDSRELAEVPPFGHVVDYLGYGGLYREAGLIWKEPVAISDLWVRARAVPGGARTASATVGLDNPRGLSGPAAMRWTLAGAEGELGSGTVEFRLDGTSAQTVAWSVEAAAARTWEPDDPALYTLAVTLEREGLEIDRSSERFGFREAGFTADGFFLNGRRLFLRGLNRHQSFPYQGNAMPRSAQRRDAEILKHELGLDCVRSSHYPASRHFLDRCDEIGLLVFEELPGWQHIGGSAWKDCAVDQLSEMIMQDRNHPSVILWGARINESQDDDDFYRRTNARARELDPDRQTGGVRNFAGSRLLEDVYTFNDFTHDGSAHVIQDPRKVAGSGKPYLITEHNGHMFPAKSFDNEARLVEHALRHARVLDRAMGTPGVSGAFGWCFADYNTHRDFGSGDRVCYHGVMDMFRLPKPAAALYASQRDGSPFMEVCSRMAPGEYDRADLPRVLVLTNCDAVEVLANGESIGLFRPDRDGFPNLPHPPVIVDDFIGDLLERREGFSGADARLIKGVFKAVIRHGENRLPLRWLLAMGWLLLKNRMSYARAVELFGTYMAHWGEELTVWTFAGIRDGVRVVEVTRGPHQSERLELAADAPELIERGSWDAVRIVARHVDEHGQILRFSTEVLSIEVDGPAELLGPAAVPLVGGARAFWVRSVGQSGEVTVRVRTERHDERVIRLAACANA